MTHLLFRVRLRLRALLLHFADKIYNMAKTRIVIVSIEDEIIGHKERDAVAQSDTYRVTALWITNSVGDILLAQRKFTKKHDPGMWGPAVAGTVEEGETYDTNIVKEAEEEIGLKNIQLAKGPKRRMKGEHTYFVQWYTLVVDKPVSEFVVQQDEVEYIKWFSRKELEKELRDHPDKYRASLNWALKTFSS